jgi:branched-subunit amino acid transport protein
MNKLNVVECTADNRQLMQISFLVICLLAAIVIPRIFIHTTDSTQFVDPQHPATLSTLFTCL